MDVSVMNSFVDTGKWNSWCSQVCNSTAKWLGKGGAPTFYEKTSAHAVTCSKRKLMVDGHLTLAKCQILKLHASLYDTNPNFMHYFSGKALTFSIEFCINFDLFQKWVTFLAPGKDRWLASHSHGTLVNSWPLTIRHRTWEWRSPSYRHLLASFLLVPLETFGLLPGTKIPENWHLSITTDTATLSGMEAKGRPLSYLGPCRKSWPSLKPTYCWWTKSGVHQLIW